MESGHVIAQHTLKFTFFVSFLSIHSIRELQQNSNMTTTTTAMGTNTAATITSTSSTTINNTSSKSLEMQG